MISRSRK